MVARVYREPVRIAAAVRDPGSAGGAQDRIERHGQSARRLNALDASARGAVDVGLAIGDRDELRIPESSFEQRVQRVFAPERFSARPRSGSSLPARF